MNLVPLLTSLTIVLSAMYVGGCTTTSSKMFKGEPVAFCPVEIEDKAIMESGSDYTPETAMSAAKESLLSKRSVPEALQKRLLTKTFGLCFNADDSTFTSTLGFAPEPYQQMHKKLLTETNIVLNDKQTTSLDRFKKIMTLSHEITGYQEAQKFLSTIGVSIPPIRSEAVFAKLEDAKKQLMIAVKFKEERYTLQEGNVTRNIYLDSFVKMGLKVTDAEHLTVNPTAVISVDNRWEKLQTGGSTQEFFRVYSVVTVYDAQSAVVATANLEAKGGGVNEKAAQITALRNLESKILTSLFQELFPRSEGGFPVQDGSTLLAH